MLAIGTTTVPSRRHDMLTQSAAATRGPGGQKPVAIRGPRFAEDPAERLANSVMHHDLMETW